MPPWDWCPLIEGTGDERVGIGMFGCGGPVFRVRYLTWSESSLTDCSSSRIRDCMACQHAHTDVEYLKKRTSWVRRASLCQVMTSFLRLRISE